VWILVAISFAANIVPTNRLNRLALFYSSHLISSLLVLAAVFVASRYASIPAIANQSRAAEANTIRG
jgi:hypothetical protein